MKRAPALDPTGPGLTGTLKSAPLDVGLWLTGHNRFRVRLLPSSLGTNLRYYRGWQRHQVKEVGGGLVEGRFRGGRMVLNLRDKVITRVLIHEGVWEPYETELVGRLAAGARIALDLGANVGYYTLLLSRVAQKVYAFEPQKGNFDLLRRNVAANSLRNVVCLRRAVADRPGPARIYLDRTNFGNHNMWCADGGREVEDVEAVSLDEFLADAATEVDFIKMDIQGAELLALKGMRRLLSESRRVKLALEYWPYALSRMGADPPRLLGALEDAGFRVFKIDGVRRELTTRLRLDHDDPRASADLLCVRAP